MKKIFYYTPLIQELGMVGFRISVKAKTKMWTTENRKKVEIYTTGPTADAAAEKLKHIISVGNTPTEELPVNYFLCSAEVVKRIQPLKASKPLFRKRVSHLNKEIFIALLNFSEVKTMFDALEADPLHDHDFWAEECVDGLMDVSDANIPELKRYGLFKWLCEEAGMSKENNIAMSVYKIAKNEGLTPIELFNKLAE